MSTSTNETDETCEACFGTKQDTSMRSPYPPRQILYRECPVCNGTGKKPKPD
jgi:DnaJ-class molecular chaperone